MLTVQLQVDGDFDGPALELARSDRGAPSSVRELDRAPDQGREGEEDGGDGEASVQQRLPFRGDYARFFVPRWGETGRGKLILVMKSCDAI